MLSRGPHALTERAIAVADESPPVCNRSDRVNDWSSELQVRAASKWN